MTFEWDASKNEKNFRIHKIHFESVIVFFDDENPDIEYDEIHSVMKDRYRGTFQWHDHYQFVVYTLRSEVIRRISARPETRGEIEHYYTRT